LQATVKSKNMAVEQDPKSFTRADILSVIGILIAVGFGVLPYFHPPDPAHPWNLNFFLRTVSFPLWKTIFGIFAVMAAAFQLGTKRSRSTSGSNGPAISHSSPTPPSPVHASLPKPHIDVRPIWNVANHSDELELDMPDRYTVRIHRHESGNLKGLAVTVDNNRLEAISKISITIYSAQSFDQSHGAFRDGIGFNAGIISQPNNILPSTSGKTDWFVRKDPKYPNLLAFDDTVHAMPWPSNDKSSIQKWRLTLGITAQMASKKSNTNYIEQFPTEKMSVIVEWDSEINQFTLKFEKTQY